MISKFILPFVLLCVSYTASAAPEHYTIDPYHTYPSFQADHMGLSYWRGKFNHSAGAVILDRSAKAGTVDITVDIASVDFGMDKLDAWARGPQFFVAEQYPKAVYHGKLTRFRHGAPTRVVGTLTLHGVSRPLTLTIDRFKCIPDPMLKRQRCGADAVTAFQRDRFGLTAGKEYGFDMKVLLSIQIEAVADK